MATQRAHSKAKSDGEGTNEELQKVTGAELRSDPDEPEVNQTAIGRCQSQVIRMEPTAPTMVTDGDLTAPLMAARGRTQRQIEESDGAPSTSKF
jgi:hypothetical protein